MVFVLLYVDWNRRGGFTRPLYYDVVITTLDTPARYYSWQLPLFVEASKNFKLHWCWTSSEGNDKDFPDQINKLTNRRFRALLLKARKFHRRDALVQRDKCKLHLFFRTNRIPMLEVVRGWRNYTHIMTAVHTMTAFTHIEKWPTFLFGCHLSLDRAHSMFRIESEDWARQHEKDVMDFINEKWIEGPQDVENVWPGAAKDLVPMLTPGFMLQGPTHLSYHDEYSLMRAFEVKTQVFWGRAYLGELVVDDVYEFDGQHIVFLRGMGESEFEHHNPHGSIDYLNFHKIRSPLPFPSWNWVVKERHLACVWALSQSIAKILAIDYVRVDVFIVRGRPFECKAKDISLVHTSQLRAHERHMGKLWAETLKAKQYTVVGNASSPPAFRFTDVPS